MRQRVVHQHVGTLRGGAERPDGARRERVPVVLGGEEVGHDWAPRGGREGEVGGGGGAERERERESERERENKEKEKTDEKRELTDDLLG